MTTWWDVYETMMHLLLDQTNMNSIKSSYLNDLSKRKRASSNMPKGKSLFLPISNRNCESANIPAYLCSCTLSFDIDIKDKIIQSGALYVVDYINTVLLNRYQDICMVLKFKSVIDAQISKQKTTEYSIIFDTYPNEAKFDAKFQIQPGYKDKFNLIGKIIRINSYGLSSKCIKNYELRNFCYCYSYAIQAKKKSKKTNFIRK